MALLALGPARAAGAPVWSDSDAAILGAALDEAGREGLDPRDYAVPPMPAGQARDMRLTSAAIAYVRDLRLGRARLKALDDDVQLPPQDFDAAAALDAALQNHRLGPFLAGAAPPQPEYAALRKALAFYRGVAVKGGWPALPDGTPADFADGKNAALLRRRLAYEDPAAALPGADVTEAVKRFQARHGLDADGRVGARTLAELNMTADARVQQIVANMERWRWLPRQFEASYIAINVPDARLALTLDGKRVLESRVVVGKPKTPTPIMRAEGAGVTINPPWNVPASIARREILPKLKANPSYLKSQDMILVNGPPGDPHGLHVNWRAIPAGTFPYRIQQHPGPKNSLGTIKIELPNKFAVYLHDTPAKQAFNRPARDLSHGCVRVEQILPLASYALASNLSATDMLSNAVAAGKTQYLPLERRLPVYFLYWTAFAEADGTFQFRPDIYGRDARLIAALQKGAAMRVSANTAKCVKARG